ncbi:MAG: phosphopyruvate hydratase [Patescibacteria group bacterium]
MRVKDITVREIFDSRSGPTIEVRGRNPLISASVPSGKSRGNREAKVFSFREAFLGIKTIVKNLGGRNFQSVRDLDEALLRLDGTANKSKLGGNVTLAVSMFGARMLAAERGKEVWQVLREEFFKGAKDVPPLIFSNLINGGAHAANNLDIQEYMVVVHPVRTSSNGVKSGKSVAEDIQALIRFYRELGDLFKKTRKIQNIPIGDEGGYSLNFKSNFEPITVLEKLVKKFHLESRFGLALDVAASGFLKNGEYYFSGKRFSSEQLAAEYLCYFKKSKFLFSVEDPFAERDAQGFALLREKLPDAWVVGDDLTTTNPTTIQKYAHEGVINAVIIKPNQIGTISEACKAIAVAKKHGLKTIVSHRSGETEDSFITHLAKAGGADGVKIGAPIRERISKFNELARIY